MRIHSCELSGMSALRAPALTFSALVLVSLAGVATAQDSINVDEIDEIIEEIVVTGSKLRRVGSSAPIPVTTITAEDLTLSGATSIGDLVNELPSMALGANRQTNFSADTPAEVGTNLLNLRNLGTNRTLVLVNGRRHVGSVAGSTSVDINSIPIALVERVEVSTGGASVAYGADAVSGVVNFVLKDDFEGVQIDAQTGISAQSDSEDYSFSITGGGNFAAGRGNAVISASYNNVNGIRGPDRDWVLEQNVLIPNPADTGPSDGIPAQILATGGRISIAPTNLGYVGLVPFDLGTNAIFVNDDGSIRPLDPGVLTGGIFDIGGDGVNLAEITTVANPLERISINGQLNYQVRENARLFLEVKYYGVETSNEMRPTSDFVVKTDGSLFLIAADNPFAPFGDPLFDQFFADNFGFVTYTGIHFDLGPRTAIVERNTARVVVGFDGELPGTGLTYEVYYQHGQTDEVRTVINDRDNRRFILATDVTVDVAGVLGSPGAPVCRATLAAAGAPTGDSAVDGCIPLNIFGGVASQEAIDFVSLDLVSRAKLSQDVFSASIAGSVLELPAGALSIAGGIEYREEKSSTQPDSALVQGRQWTGVNTLPVVGSYDALEGFLEARIPLLTDARFAKILAIEGGVRLSDYNTVGQTTAWRLNGEWAPLHSLRFRVGYAQAVRAPNISELFSPQQGAFANISDPCDRNNVNLGPNPARRLANCTEILAAFGLDPLTYDDPLVIQLNSILLGGNSALIEETAESFTAGFVFTPHQIPRLVATVDFFDIEITDAVSIPSLTGIVEGCVDRFDSIDNELCALFERSNSPGQLGGIENVIGINRNIAALEVRGVDFGISYGFDLQDVGIGGNSGSLRLGVTGTYLKRLGFLEDVDADFDEAAGEIGAPELRFNLQAVYDKGPYSVSWLMRYIGSGDIDVQDPNPAEFSDPFGVPDATVHDLQVRFDYGKGDLYFGVNDLFDKTPPPLARGNNGPGAKAFYDQIGTFFYLGMRFRM